MIAYRVHVMASALVLCQRSPERMDMNALTYIVCDLNHPTQALYLHTYGM